MKGIARPENVRSCASPRVRLSNPWAKGRNLERVPVSDVQNLNESWSQFPKVARPKSRRSAERTDDSPPTGKTVPFGENSIEESGVFRNLITTNPPRLSTMRTRAGSFLYRNRLRSFFANRRAREASGISAIFVDKESGTRRVKATHPPRLSTMRTRAGIFLYRSQDLKIGTTEQTGSIQPANPVNSNPGGGAR